MKLGLTRGRIDEDAGSETRRCEQVSPGEAGNAQVLASLGVWGGWLHLTSFQLRPKGLEGGEGFWKSWVLNDLGTGKTALTVQAMF